MYDERENKFKELRTYSRKDSLEAKILISISGEVLSIIFSSLRPLPQKSISGSSTFKWAEIFSPIL
jgi:hypothetical protein